jgi:hypothetical protein
MRLDRERTFAVRYSPLTLTGGQRGSLYLTPHDTPCNADTCGTLTSAQLTGEPANRMGTELRDPLGADIESFTQGMVTPCNLIRSVGKVRRNRCSAVQSAFAQMDCTGDCPDGQPFSSPHFEWGVSKGIFP